MEIVKILSAALTPVLGILAAYIAWQQWRTNHLKVRHDLYERRLAIYFAVMEFLASIMRTANPNDTEAITFLQKTRESYFLFGNDLADYLETIYKNSIDLQVTAGMLNDPMSRLPVGDKRTELIRKKSELMGWFTNQPIVAREKFSKYMRLY